MAKCWRDKERFCSGECEAYSSTGVVYGLDSRKNLMTGHCIELGLKAQLVTQLAKVAGK